MKFVFYLVFSFIWASIKSQIIKSTGKYQNQMDLFMLFLSICLLTDTKTYAAIFTYRLQSIQILKWKPSSLQSLYKFIQKPKILKNLYHLVQRIMKKKNNGGGD